MLTFFGGILVLFMYVSSLSPNEPLIFGFGGILVAIFSLFFDRSFNFFSDEVLYNGILEVGLMVRIFSFELRVILGFLIIYVLYVLFVVVELIKIRFGALKLIYEEKWGCFSYGHALFFG